jgi:hypothetical protein
MTRLQQALRGAGHVQRRAAPKRRAILVGAGGTLGSAVLEQLLGCSAFDNVAAVVQAPMAPAMRGFQAVSRAALDLGVELGAGGRAAMGGGLAADTALVVFDRQRQANGRELVFHVPQPAELPALAAALLRNGVTRLLVVLPHAPALLPQALKAGLASLDEQAVAALGFEHVVFVRPAQAGGDVQMATAGRSTDQWLQRVAHAMLSQLHLMVPQRDQPVRAVMVARFVMQVARALPEATAGTRVASPDLVWLAAQAGDSRGLVSAWLQGSELPAGPAAQPRL